MSSFPNLDETLSAAALIDSSEQRSSCITERLLEVLGTSFLIVAAASSPFCTLRLPMTISYDVEDSQKAFTVARPSPVFPPEISRMGLVVMLLTDIEPISEFRAAPMFRFVLSSY